MSAVGAGVQAKLESAPALYRTSPQQMSSSSTWNNTGGFLFRDSRARNEGDIVTIDISIDDRATFGNQSNRSKEAKVSSSYEYLLKILGLDSGGTAAADIQSSSSTNGKGDIQRSEKIKMSIAAIVSKAMPNGNLLISGSQEIRVNYELRVLRIEGIVKPEDISKDNRVSYDKIAEARVSYGGRGRIMEVQQPQLGQQVYDLVRPF
jgi:flagellar L-ring protein precursor FlgH